MGMLALVTALWGGLVRLGWNLPPLRLTLPAAHGPLMVSGFLGTLIAVERAVALRRGWTYLGPLLTGLGALALIAGVPGPVAPLLMTLGSLGLVAVFVVIIRRQTALFTIVMGLGAVTWFIGNGLWLAGRSIPSVALWWAGFLVLTIAGERLELSRVRRLTRGSQISFLAAVVLFVLGLVLTIQVPDVGVRLASAGLVALALWLLHHDIARRTVHQTGLTRFIAVCLLAGYVWLGIGGVLGLLFGGDLVAGPHYDAMLHTLFLGFVFSMIFGHAPIILPAVMRVPVSFHPRFYAHLGLLHFSLLLRVAGDLAGWPSGRRWGGLLNVAALLLFLVSTVRAARSARRSAGRSPGRHGPTTDDGEASTAPSPVVQSLTTSSSPQE